MSTLLKVSGLTVQFKMASGVVCAVDHVSFSLNKKEILGVVGESGSGKSQLFFSLLGLLADNGVATGEALFEGTSLLNLTEFQLNKVRTKEIGIVFQGALSALHPYKRISPQLTEVLAVHEGIKGQEAEKRVVEMLERVCLADAKNVLKRYPYELSGGMKQRVLLAMALLCKPKILIADEPTTALDVSTQAQILYLLHELQRDMGMSVVIITHDLGVVAGLSDRLLVMYGGKIMESGMTAEVLKHPKHPYTKALLNSMPTADGASKERLSVIPGSPPNLLKLARVGCPFYERCLFSENRCRFLAIQGEDSGPIHFSACPYY